MYSNRYFQPVKGFLHLNRSDHLLRRIEIVLRERHLLAVSNNDHSVDLAGVGIGINAHFACYDAQIKVGE